MVHKDNIIIQNFYCYYIKSVFSKQIEKQKIKTEKFNKIEGEEILKKFEEKNGKILNQAKRELEQLATRKQEIDESKALTLEEYSKLIQQLKKKIADQDKRNIIAPLAEERDKLKKEYDIITEETKKLKHNNYPVVDNDNKCLGLLRLTDLENVNKNVKEM